MNDIIPYPLGPAKAIDHFERVLWKTCEGGDLVEIQRLLESGESQGFRVNLVPIFQRACWENLPLSEWLLAKDPTLANSVCRHDYEHLTSEDELIPWVKGTCCSLTAVEEVD